MTNRMPLLSSHPAQPLGNIQHSQLSSGFLWRPCLSSPPAPSHPPFWPLLGPPLNVVSPPSRAQSWPVFFFRLFTFNPDNLITPVAPNTTHPPRVSKCILRPSLPCELQRIPTDHLHLMLHRPFQPNKCCLYPQRRAPGLGSGRIVLIENSSSGFSILLCQSSALNLPVTSRLTHKNPKALDSLEPLPPWIYLLFLFPFLTFISSHTAAFLVLPGTL